MSAGLARRAGPQQRLVAGATAVAAAVILAGLILILTTGGPRARHRGIPTLPPSTTVTATGYVRHRIYHSPQSPGFTSWVGAWVMPDGALMTAFDQATGPVDPAQRVLMPERVLEQSFGLTEQLGNSSRYTYLNPDRDMWGLQQSVVFLRSTDGGAIWRIWRTDPFHALSAEAYTPQADLALSNGMLLRRISGSDLANDPDIPHAALIESLPLDAADDGGARGRWSNPVPLLHDPAVCTDGISRMRELTDGRVVAMGAVWGFVHGTSGPCATQAFSVLLLVASSPTDAARGDWALGMPFTHAVVPDEWDVAELPDGNLLALFRTEIDGQPVRRLAILKRAAHGWTMGTPYAPPAIPAFAPSGHPELLATRQGVILSIASTGTAYTIDGGRTWKTLPFTGEPSSFRYTSYYYPRAVQARDGTIYVFSSLGWDIPYGAFDEAIVMDHFRLVLRRR